MSFRKIGKRLQARAAHRDAVVARIRVNGRTVALHALDAEACRIVERIARDQASIDLDTVGRLYDAFARACPELSRDDVLALSPTEVGGHLGRAFACTPGSRMVRPAETDR